MTKLLINFQTGTLEVEGEESFVKLIYQDYKDGLKFISNPQPKPQSPETFGTDQSTKDNKRVPVKKSNKQKIKSKESYSIVKDLDLSPNGGKQSLRDFYKEKLPNSGAAMESNAVFVYYLQKIAGVSNITLSHVYSCYKDTGTRVPAALRQSLLDTSHRKGWVDTSSFDNLVVATPGENYVEQDLPKKVPVSEE